MHRIATIPGGWQPDSEGVIFIEQTPAPIVFLTAKDTDIQTLAQAITKLPKDFPAIRVVNLLQLAQQLTIDTYAEEVLQAAKVIIIRLLGGREYWSYGLEVVRETVEQTGASLIVLPGDDRPDPTLISFSTISLDRVNRLWRYFIEEGVDNFCHALEFVCDICLGYSYNPPSPQIVPKVGSYLPNFFKVEENKNHFSKVGILFYRAHYLAGNTAVIDAICEALLAKNLEPIPVFVSSLRDLELQAEILEYFSNIDVLLNTTGFSVAKLDADEPELKLWQKLNVPVLQVILSGGTQEQWESQLRGLSPRDMAMNVALPEVDGRIITRALSFKSVQQRDRNLETEVIVYKAVDDRINFVADLTDNWAKLRHIPPKSKRIALILANYPSRDGRLANGVGLDTPASCVEILKALQKAGYWVENIPQTGDELIERLIAGITNDPEAQMRRVNQFLTLAEYKEYFATLPASVRKGIEKRWGDGNNYVGAQCLRPKQNLFPIPGIQLGNIFVGIQPARGYDLDPSLNYHAPDLEPPHAYLAFYYWLRQHFEVHAIVHVGKHGNLEWLPGKSIALSQCCYPEVAFGAMPHFYPFIVNDPGEGSQAKRRAQAVIIDHLTPPLTRAELYGNLQQIESLVDEYYEAENLDPSRLPIIRDRLCQLVQQENLHLDLSIDPESSFLPFDLSLLPLLDGYLCELKEAQIRDGLHIFGQCPQGRQLRDLLVAIARSPRSPLTPLNKGGISRQGLTRAVAKDWGLDFDPLTADPTQPAPNCPQLRGCRNFGDAIEVIEREAANLVEKILNNLKIDRIGEELAKELYWIQTQLLPLLQQTDREIINLLRGLAGEYIASGPAGAPTRGRPEVLPTGRNFYSVDIRAIPTESAWDVGRKAAELLIERYTQENGEYPQTIGLSVWGTSTMRTGGDDLAEALALLGVQPVWDGSSRRVVDFEIIPLLVLNRPRVDVTLRISGFFRDAFPNLIDLFNQAVEAVATLDEPAAQNPLAAKVQKEIQIGERSGLKREEAAKQSLYRVFGSKPGAYGAGLQGLIESQNWNSDEDLARAYINWSCYAYAGSQGYSAPSAFENRLKDMQVVLHNQDNREHDLLDSDDYYQFQGGLTVAVRSVKGTNPQTYFGDNSLPENPKIKSLKEEIAKVYRSRVVNPKWIAGVMRHGYKGAFEMAATVDYLFAYDATTRCVADFMYEGIAQAYILDEKVQQFIQEKNPWALRDMAERLLEAAQRKLWENADNEMLEELRLIAHQAEASIEQL
jgi:cobaltochelatase CobN